jgi:hypothetical protein
MAFPDLARARAAAGRLFPVLDRVPAIDSASPAGAAPREAKGEVELQGVTFVYVSLGEGVCCCARRLGCWLVAFLEGCAVRADGLTAGWVLWRRLLQGPAGC